MADLPVRMNISGLREQIIDNIRAFVSDDSIKPIIVLTCDEHPTVRAVGAFYHAIVMVGDSVIFDSGAIGTTVVAALQDLLVYTGKRLRELFHANGTSTACLAAAKSEHLSLHASGGAADTVRQTVYYTLKSVVPIFGGDGLKCVDIAKRTGLSEQACKDAVKALHAERMVKEVSRRPGYDSERYRWAAAPQ